MKTFIGIMSCAPSMPWIERFSTKSQTNQSVLKNISCLVMVYIPICLALIYNHFTATDKKQVSLNINGS